MPMVIVNAFLVYRMEHNSFLIHENKLSLVEFETILQHALCKDERFVTERKLWGPSTIDEEKKTKEINTLLNHSPADGMKQ